MKMSFYLFAPLVYYKEYCYVYWFLDDIIEIPRKGKIVMD